MLLLGLRWWGFCRVVIRCIWCSNHAPQALVDATIPLKEEQNAILLSVSMEYDLKDDLNSSWNSWGRRLNRSRPKSALDTASITSMTAFYTSKSPENHEVACSIEIYSAEEYRWLMVLPELVLYRREVSKRFLKTSRWSTYFVYVRTPKTRGFSEVFGRHFSYIFDVRSRTQDHGNLWMRVPCTSNDISIPWLPHGIPTLQITSGKDDFESTVTVVSSLKYIIRDPL